MKQILADELEIVKDARKKMERGELSKNELKDIEDKYLQLYYLCRKKNDTYHNRLTLNQRKKLHYLMLGLYKIKNKLSGFNCEVIKDEREKTDRPIIFAPTHVGKFDIEVMSPYVKDHYYLLSGDFEHLYGTFDFPFLTLNGAIYFNEKVKYDRQDVCNRMVEHLKKGGNLMYFIEGTWNLSSNLPVLPCYWGIIDIARESNAIIIPIAMEQYGKRFKVNIGKNFDVNLFSNDKFGKTEAISMLRDNLATLKWQIWQSEPEYKRKEFSGNEWEEYVDSRLQEWPYFTREYIADLIYQPKGHVTQEEVFNNNKKVLKKIPGNKK